MLESTRLLKLVAVVRTWATFAFSRASVPSRSAERSRTTTTTATASTASPATAGTSRSRSHMSCSFRGGALGEGVGDDEPCSSAVGGGHLDLAAHRGRELAHDGEPEAGAAGVDDRVAPAAEEAAEDLLALGDRHPGALVVDEELGPAFPGPRTHDDPGALGGVLRGVADEVGHHPLERLVGAADPDTLLRLDAELVLRGDL